MTPAIPNFREKVETEARARTFWGDSREEVLAFLTKQGVSEEEAVQLADTMFQERVEAIRGIGFWKMMKGLPMMAVTVATWFLFRGNMHYGRLRVFTLAVLIGVYGLYLFIRGGIMFISPKAESGEVADK